MYMVSRLNEEIFILLNHNKVRIYVCPLHDVEKETEIRK